mgnify:CR=1 FL=1
MSAIAENIAQIRERISAACERSGRNPETVRLIAVSKVKPAEDIDAAVDRFEGEGLRQVEAVGARATRAYQGGNIQLGALPGSSASHTVDDTFSHAARASPPRSSR